MAGNVSALIVCFIWVTFAVPATVAQASPPSLDQFATAVGIEGQTVQLFCRATNKGLRGVYWYLEREHDELVLGLETSDYVRNYPKFRIEVDESQGFYNLSINSLSLEDAGRWECLLSDGEYTIHGAPGTLRVLETVAPPAGPTCLVEHREPLSEADEIRASCLAAEGGRPESRLSWYDGAGRLVGGAGAGPNFTRAWRAAPDDDGAVYTCRETHPALEGTRSCTVGPLSVLHAPVVTITPADPRARVGSVAVLTCSADANPPLDDSLQWAFGNTTLTPANDTSSNASTESRFTVEEAQGADGENQSRLTIAEVAEADYGVQLTCTGRNAAGAGNATAVLMAPYPPRPPDEGDDDILATDLSLVIVLDLAALGALILLGLCFIVSPKCRCLVCECCHRRRRQSKRRKHLKLEQKRQERERRVLARRGPAATTHNNAAFDG